MACNGLDPLRWGGFPSVGPTGRYLWPLGGNISCLIGAIMGAVAQNMTTLISANAFVGLAAPAQLGFTTVVAELVPNKYREACNAAIICASLPFAVFGPIIARTLNQNTASGWRWCYYLDVITTFLASILFFFFYRPPNSKQLHNKATKVKVLKELDYIGMAFHVPGPTLFFLGFNWGGQHYPWTSSQTLGTLLGGFALLVLFILWEGFGAKVPLINLTYFKNRGYIGIVITASSGSMIYYSLNVLWPTQITHVYTTDPICIGWMSCAVGGATLLGQLTGGALVRHLGRQKWQMTFCAVFMTALIGAMASTTPSSEARAVILCCFGSFFVGYIVVSSITNAPLCLAPEDLGLATGLLSSIRSALSAIAISVYSSILANKIKANVPKCVIPAALHAGLPKSSLYTFITALTTGMPTSAVQGATLKVVGAATEALKTAYASSFEIVYLTSLAFGGVAIIAALCSPEMESKCASVVSRRLHGKTTVTVKTNGDEEKAGNVA